jgi:hypothetical protein
MIIHTDTGLDKVVRVRDPRDSDKNVARSARLSLSTIKTCRIPFLYYPIAKYLCDYLKEELDEDESDFGQHHYIVNKCVERELIKLVVSYKKEYLNDSDSVDDKHFSFESWINFPHIVMGAIIEAWTDSGKVTTQDGHHLVKRMEHWWTASIEEIMQNHSPVDGNGGFWWYFYRCYRKLEQEVDALKVASGVRERVVPLREIVLPATKAEDDSTVNSLNFSSSEDSDADKDDDNDKEKEHNDVTVNPTSTTVSPDADVVRSTKRARSESSESSKSY